MSKVGNVRIQYPVHRTAADAVGQRIQRLVRVAPGTEAVGEPHVGRLVERIEHLHHRALDNLVFQRSNAQRSLPPVRAGV